MPASIEGGGIWVFAPGGASAEAARRPVAEEAAAAPGAVPIAFPNGGPDGLGARVFNFVLASAALIALSPFLAVLALAIRLTSRGPVIYAQTRVGMDYRERGRHRRNPERRSEDLGGRPFRIYKFRTMAVDAERGTGPVWAQPNDHRATRVGRFLRRTRLDELPQLWNVIRGDMNITGPRPERPALVAVLTQEVHNYRLRHRVRPGITGWAQVNQPYDTTIQSVRSKLMYDLDYIVRRSVLFDLYIMLRTLPALYRRLGW